MSGWWALWWALVLLVVNAGFVGAEFALLAARRHRLEQMAADGRRGAGLAVRASSRLSLMLAGAQLGITACSLGIGALAEPALAHVLADVLGRTGLGSGASHVVALVVALAVVSLVHLVVGEMVPKSWAMAEPERAALRLGGAMWWFCVLGRPVIAALDGVSNAVVRLAGVQPGDGEVTARTRGELLTMIAEDLAPGELGEGATEMLSRSIRMGELVAADAMTGRDQVVWVDRSASVAEAAGRMHESGRSRLVVCDGDIDTLVGVLHVKDVLTMAPGQRASTQVADLVRTVQTTSAGTSLEELLGEMRSSRSHLAVVVDGGGVAGVVTLEDVVEEVIGDFDDETDVAGAPGGAAVR